MVEEGPALLSDPWSQQLHSSSTSRSPSPTVSPGLQWTLFTCKDEQTTQPLQNSDVRKTSQHRRAAEAAAPTRPHGARREHGPN